MIKLRDGPRVHLNGFSRNGKGSDSPSPATVRPATRVWAASQPWGDSRCDDAAPPN